MPDWPVAPLPEPAFDVGLLATWTWRPNEEALRWFLDNVYPRLPREVTIHVAGPGAEWLRGLYPNVTQRGFVKDAADFLRAARLIAVPTRYGSGLETKMLAAIASGSAIVATSASIRGLGRVPASVAVADEADEFAQRIADRLARAASDTGDRKEALAWRAARRRDFFAVLGRELSALAPEADFGGHDEMERMRDAV
jgi:glycosyltransferase involved in cell wall biosynthesis